MSETLEIYTPPKKKKKRGGGGDKGRKKERNVRAGEFVMKTLFLFRIGIRCLTT